MTRKGMIKNIYSWFQNGKYTKDNISEIEDRYGPVPVDFDADIYRKLNTDLDDVLRYDWQAAAHYLMHGRHEGRSCSRRLIVALDGHDGSGKTTLANIIAERVGGRVIKPFGGSFGQYMLWLSSQRKYSFLSRAAQLEVDSAFTANCGDYPLVIDRHALTMSVLLARSFHCAWRPFAFTFLCYADSSTVIDRIRSRGENVGFEHRHILGISRFRRLAEAKRIPIIETSTQCPYVAADSILKLISNQK